jgi:hypothetical protein
MDAELRVAIERNADVGRHNLGLKQYAIRFSILHVAPALPVGGPLGRGSAHVPSVRTDGGDGFLWRAAAGNFSTPM